MDCAEERDVSVATACPWHELEEKVLLCLCTLRWGLWNVPVLTGQVPQNCSFRQSELNEKCGVGIKEKPDLPCQQQYQDQKVQELI